jgi:hypothetical protein
VASNEEIQLGRVLVNQELLTQEQVLTLIRCRNEAPDGPDLGALMVARGLVNEAQLAEARQAVADGQGNWVKPRHEMSTAHEISLSSTRETVARECLNEALEELSKDRAGAIQEIRRLADEFSDTESGNRALEHLKALGEA